MKKLIVSIALILFVSAAGFAQNAAADQTFAKATFGVRGNCGMCKTTIEKAASGTEGIKSAVWNKEKKKMEVSFDASQTSATAIQRVVAAAGYDTEKVKANSEAYAALPACCRYDKKMEMTCSEGEKKYCAAGGKMCSKKENE